MRAFSNLVVRIGFPVALFAIVCLVRPGVALADQVCYCSIPIAADSLAKDTPISTFDDHTKFNRACLPDATVSDCVDGYQSFPSCGMVDSADACAKKQASYDSDLENAKQVFIQGQNGTLPTTGGSSSGGTQSPQGLLAKVLPDCVFDNTVQGECKDVNIFIKLAIDLANVLLSIIGGIALIAFLYGGFILILSEGNSEKIEKGKGAMMAALIGLAVVFAAYLIVNVLSDALGVSSSFRLQ